MIRHKNSAVLIIFFSLCCWIGYAVPQNKTYQVNVGVLLDDLDSLGAKIWSSCLDMAVSDFYSANPHYKTRLVFKTRDCRRSVFGAAAAAVDLIKNEEVQVILGPATSMQTFFVIKIGEQANVPIISFSATNPALTSLKSPYFFQLSQNDSSQTRAISAIVKAFGWKKVVPIVVDDMFSEGVLSALTAALQDMDADVPHRSFIRALATDDQIVEELKGLMMMETRVFIVHMSTDLACRLYTKAKELGMMSEGYVWISTTELLNSLNSLNFSVLEAMQGVLGVQTYIPRTSKLEELKRKWEQQFQKDNPNLANAHLNVYKLQLYDAVHAVAIAVEKVGSRFTDIGLNGFHKSKDSFKYPTDLENLGVSRHGWKVRQALSATKFDDGLFGSFNLVDRQLQSSTLKLVNVNLNGDGATRVGFWTSKNGLMRKLDSPLDNSSTFSTSKSNIGPIIWPGESLTVPKGWEYPENGKKWRIGVLVKPDFFEFVRVSKDPKTGRTEVTGACADIFKAVLKLVPYAVDCEFIPFAKPDGTRAGTENDLCYQVHQGIFDGVLGDTTINAGQKSLSIGFSMPYMEANIVMVVPVINHQRKSLWTIFKPWKWDLWLSTTCIWLYISFVLWILGRPNPDYAGRPVLYQICAAVLLSIPIVFLANAERVRNNMAMLVMIVWMLLLSILIQSYLVNLAAHYTDQTVKPSATDINHLRMKGEKVGYITGTYTYDLLRQAGFDDSKLKGFNTKKEIDEALSKGSAKGGVSACVGETFHMQLFLERYCDKYTIIGPVFRTMGYGFVFSERSSLLPDISQAIVKLGREKILNISNMWFTNQSVCQKLNPSSKFVFLDFWNLFLVVIIISIIALIVHFADDLGIFIQDSWESVRDMFNRIVRFCVRAIQ